MADLGHRQLPRRGPQRPQLAQRDAAPQQPAGVLDRGAGPTQRGALRHLPRLPRRRRQRCDEDGGLDGGRRPAGPARRAGMDPPGQQPPAVVGRGEHVGDADPALLGPPAPAQLRLQPQSAVLGDGEVEDPVGEHALDDAEPRTQVGHAEQRLRHPQLAQEGAHPGAGPTRLRSAHPHDGPSAAGRCVPGRARDVPPCWDAGPDGHPDGGRRHRAGALARAGRRPRGPARPPGRADRVAGPPAEGREPATRRAGRGRGRPAGLPGVPARLRSGGFARAGRLGRPHHHRPQRRPCRRRGDGGTPSSSSRRWV